MRPAALILAAVSLVCVGSRTQAFEWLDRLLGRQPSAEVVYSTDYMQPAAPGASEPYAAWTEAPFDGPMIVEGGYPPEFDGMPGECCETHQPRRRPLRECCERMKGWLARLCGKHDPCASDPCDPCSTSCCPTACCVPDPCACETCCDDPCADPCRPVASHKPVERALGCLYQRACSFRRAREQRAKAQREYAEWSATYGEPLRSHPTQTGPGSSTGHYTGGSAGSVPQPPAWIAPPSGTAIDSAVPTYTYTYPSAGAIPPAPAHVPAAAAAAADTARVPRAADAAEPADSGDVAEVLALPEAETVRAGRPEFDFDAAGPALLTWPAE